MNWADVAILAGFAVGMTFIAGADAFLGRWRQQRDNRKGRP